MPVENRLPLIIGVSWDITDMKNAELEIVEARIRAEESDRLKSAFLANMSHEIRTPLNAIVGFAKLIGEVETEEEKQQFIDIIDVNSELLLQLINDILDISKIEAGTLEFRFRPMNLNDLCRSELEVHKPRVKPGVELVFEERVANVEIVCDQNRLAQVISNLLNNAGKFTEEGEIRFGFDLKDGCVEFFVQDTGMGIPPEKARNMLRPVRQTQRFQCPARDSGWPFEMIVEKLDGTIGVESEPGKGTRFHFSMPRRPPGRQRKTTSSFAPPRAGRRQVVGAAGRRGFGHQFQTHRSRPQPPLQPRACPYGSRGRGHVRDGTARCRADGHPHARDGRP